MPRSKLLVFLFSLLLLKVEAQLVLTNYQVMDPDRYSHIKKSPFYFKENVELELKLRDIPNAYDIKSANYNLLTQFIEVYKNGKYVEIEPDEIQYAIFNLDGNKIILLPIDSKTKESQFILWLDANTKIINKVRAKVSKKKFNTPGKTIEKTVLTVSDNYYFVNDTHTEKVSLKKSEIASILKKYSDIVINDQKGKLKNKWELLAFLNDHSN